jgi:hypothetical protein
VLRLHCGFRVVLGAKGSAVSQRFSTMAQGALEGVFFLQNFKLFLLRKLLYSIDIDYYL